MVSMGLWLNGARWGIRRILNEFQEVSEHFWKVSGAYGDVQRIFRISFTKLLKPLKTLLLNPMEIP